MTSFKPTFCILATLLWVILNAQTHKRNCVGSMVSTLNRAVTGMSQSVESTRVVWFHPAPAFEVLYAASASVPRVCGRPAAVAPGSLMTSVAWERRGAVFSSALSSSLTTPQPNNCFTGGLDIRATMLREAASPSVKLLSMETQ